MDLSAEGVLDVAGRDFALAAGLRYGQGLFLALALPPQQAAASANPSPDPASHSRRNAIARPS
jgi:EAL domain-containing protein (putative c-di-GMP-specific phosphodiesterase class I)